MMEETGSSLIPFHPVYEYRHFDSIFFRTSGEVIHFFIKDQGFRVSFAIR